MAFELIPNSSTILAMLSMPVLRRIALASGESVGIVLPRESRINDRISMAIPVAVNQVR